MGINRATLYIEQEAANYPESAVFESQFKDPGVIIRDPAAPCSKTGTSLSGMINSAPDPIQKGKETILLTRNKGAFIKACPGTRYYTCCGYQILHIGTFCVMDCSYCILQSYFHRPAIRFFVNHDEMFRALDRVFEKKRISRIGTGEFTDSMIWERWFPLSERLVPKFAGQSRAILELKTKTTFGIEALKGLNHNRKTVMAWSLNTEEVIRKEERNTASLSARLRAAAKCEAYGYPLAFHFDPMVIYDGCEAAYIRVIDRIFEHVSPENIVWISLGTFRFMPSLKPIIQKRFPDSKIVYGEFIQGMDGKMRYFKPLRIRLFQKAASRIKELAPETTVYFCMEDDEVWEKSLGFLPWERGGLPLMLDQSAIKVCGLESP